MPGPALEYGYAVQRFVNLVHLLAKIGFATAENGPRKVSLQPRRGFSKFANKYLPEIDLDTVSSFSKCLQSHFDLSISRSMPDCSTQGKYFLTPYCVLWKCKAYLQVNCGPSVWIREGRVTCHVWLSLMSLFQNWRCAPYLITGN